MSGPYHFHLTPFLVGFPVGFVITFAVCWAVRWAVLRWRRAKPTPRLAVASERKTMLGTTLQPGETGLFEIELPPELQERVAAGAVVSYKELPAVHDGGGRWHRDIAVLLNGTHAGKLRVEWAERP